jgi:hypothetical protein
VEAFKLLKKMTAYRQVEAADLMNSASNYSVSFAKAILAGTKPDDLIEPTKKHVNGLAKDQVVHMEQELELLQHDLTAIKDNYASDTLSLSISVKYIASILANQRVLQYLNKHHPDLLRELQDVSRQPTE